MLILIILYNTVFMKQNNVSYYKLFTQKWTFLLQLASLEIGDELKIIESTDGKKMLTQQESKLH